MGIARWGIRAGIIIANSPNNKGNFGEMIVASVFDPRFFGNEEHYLINNIYFETGDGKTHQIDHVAIYKTGIFCIESKNIKGKIIGDSNYPKWAVINNDKKYGFLNPIKQNETHVKILRAFLESNYDVHSIIVFINKNKPNDSTSSVLNIDELRDYIKNYDSDVTLTSEQMKAVYETLSNHKNSSKITKTEHIKNIHKK